VPSLSTQARHASAFNAIASGNVRKLRRMLAGGLDPNLVSNRKHGQRGLLQAVLESPSCPLSLLDTLTEWGARPTGRAWSAAVHRGDAVARWQEAWLPAARAEWGEAAARAARTHRNQADAREFEQAGLTLALGRAPDAATARRLLTWGAQVSIRHLTQKGLVRASDDPLAQAVGHARADVAAVLLAAGAPVKNGWNALREAIAFAFPADLARGPAILALARLLLDQAPLPPDLDDGVQTSETLLAQWAGQGFVEGVRLLLDAGARPHPSRPVATETARAVRQGQGTLESMLDHSQHRLGRLPESRANFRTVLALLASHGASLEAAPSHPGFATVREWARSTLPAWKAELDALALTADLPIHPSRPHPRVRL